MVECGIQLKRVQQEVFLNGLKGCLISHEHMDHSKYCKEIARYTKVYASLGTLNALDFGSFVFNVEPLVPQKQTQIGTFTIVPFQVQHDAVDPLGFLIYSKATNEKLLFATDTYYIKSTFRDLDYIMVECNYQSELLKCNLESGRTQSTIAKRLFSSHFEFENVKKFLESMDLAKVKKIYLLHLSEKNSNAEEMKNGIMALTGKPVEVCEE